MRWMNRLATALIVLAIAAGPPLFAVLWLREHLEPTPNLTSIQEWLQRPRTATDLVYATMFAGFLLWLLMIVHVVRRVAARLRRIPMPTPAQVTVSSMAGVAALTLPSTTFDQEASEHSTTTSTPPADPNRHITNTPTSTPPTVPGIALPGGGWVPSHTAAAVAALTTAIWLNRRRSYHPDPMRIATHHSDPDLASLPPATHAIASAQASQPKPADAEMPEHLPSGVLRLYGPGAAAAARGLALTTALAHTAAPTPAGLAIQGQHRKSVLPGVDDADLADIGITLLPATSDTDLGSDTPSHTAPPGTTVLVIDDTGTEGTSWYVTTDGSVTGTGITAPRRLCVLDSQTAADLLRLALLHRRKAPAVPSPRTHVEEPRPHHRGGPSRPGRLDLLGDCRLTVNGEPVRLRRTAGLQVLAYLAVHLGGATRAELITAIWPNLPPSSIAQRLHTTLSDLRGQLQPVIENPILRENDRYRLNTEMMDTDLLQWRRLAAQARKSISDIARADACRKLLDLYRGDLAAGQSWPWIEPSREELRRDALDACRHLADQTEPAEAISWLRRALAVDPYNAAVQEELARRLAERPAGAEPSR
jgi:DNA-binding SARP family transcriptional activator